MNHYCHYCEKEKDESKFDAGRSFRMCIACFKKRRAKYWQRIRIDAAVKRAQRKAENKPYARNKIDFFYAPMYIPVPRVDEKVIESREDTCSYFGCPKRLSLIEKLCGNVCTAHMGMEETVFHNGLL